MTKEEHIGFWLDSAERNLNSAQNNFHSRNYDWCLFIGHLVLEKTLKALYVKNSDNQTPPRIHNLLKLAEISNLELDDAAKLFFDKVNSFNLESRYAEYKSEFRKLPKF